MWRPSIASQKPLSNQGSVDEDSDGSMDDVEDETSSPISGPAPFPLSQPLRHRDRSVRIVKGNPGVFQGYPDPYPDEPVPTNKGTGFCGLG